MGKHAGGIGGTARIGGRHGWVSHRWLPENVARNFQRMQWAAEGAHPPIHLTIEPSKRAGHFVLKPDTPQAKTWLGQNAGHFGFHAAADGKDWQYEEPAPPAATREHSNGRPGHGSTLGLHEAVHHAPRWARHAAAAAEAGGGGGPDFQDPFADFSPELRAALQALGNPPDPQKLAELSQKYGIAVDRLKAFAEQGPLPTDLVEGGYGGQCGAWMMGERRKMGLPAWGFEAAKDLMWNYPHDKVHLTHEPKPGDVFIMTSGQYGHTGFVKSVNPDGTVTVMDSNWGLNERTHVHKIPISEISGYLEDNR